MVTWMRENNWDIGQDEWPLFSVPCTEGFDCLPILLPHKHDLNQDIPPLLWW